MLNVVSSTSTNTGEAPTEATTPAVAEKVNAGTKTASPGPAPSAISAMISASRPDDTAMQWRAPANAARSRSSASTSGPRMNWP